MIRSEALSENIGRASGTLIYRDYTTGLPLQFLQISLLMGLKVFDDTHNFYAARAFSFRGLLTYD